VSTVQIVFVDQFKGADALLILGDALGLAELEGAVRNLASNDSSAVAIHELSYVSTLCEVNAIVDSADVGISRHDLRFTWMRSPSGWLEVADKIGAVADSGNGHHYLDGPRDSVRVVVSCGEGYEYVVGH
jgi:hypothetical protein